jgi:tetratricopeptide (TPR) repeat protein
MKSPLVKVVVCTVTLIFLLPACAGPAKPVYENLTPAGHPQQGAYDAVADNISAAAAASSPGVSTAQMLSAGDYDRAIEAGRGALAASPQDDNLKDKLADAYIARAWYYKAKRLNPYTLDDLFKAVEIAPKYYRAHYELGRFHNNQWQFSIGLLDLNKALSLKPDFAPAYSERGYSNYKNQKYEAALADVNKAIELDAADGQFYYMRSLVYRGMGKNDLAMGDLETTVRLSKDQLLVDKAGADLQLLLPR